VGQRLGWAMVRAMAKDGYGRPRARARARRASPTFRALASHPSTFTGGGKSAPAAGAANPPAAGGGKPPTAAGGDGWTMLRSPTPKPQPRSSTSGEAAPAVSAAASAAPAVSAVSVAPPKRTPRSARSLSRAVGAWYQRSQTWVAASST
jgi:hypothetical protein